jgi:Mn2+/Fe2+ NRAMP family transporter
MLKSFLTKLGPGLITGAADDDPSGIATYSQAGAQFGLNTIWSIIFTFPLMFAIQTISAIIGRGSGHGLAGNMRIHYSKPILFSMIGLLLIANIINIGANLAAMGDALTLIIGGNGLFYAIAFGIFSLLLQILIPYKKYVRILKWLTMALLAYVATLFLVHLPSDLLQKVISPDIHWDKSYITTIVAIFGTTISPYLFFWQASQEVEEMKQHPEIKPLTQAPDQITQSFARIKLDTAIGMGISNFVAFCIILTAAVTLNAHGTTNIETSADAANALKPIAGEFAFLLFS